MTDVRFERADVYSSSRFRSPVEHRVNERADFNRITKCGARAMRLEERKGIGDCARASVSDAEQVRLRFAIRRSKARGPPVLLHRTARHGHPSFGCIDENKRRNGVAACVAVSTAVKRVATALR